MTTSKPRVAQTLAAWAWAAVGLTPVGWFYGFIAVVVSGLLLLAILLVSAWLDGGWINVTVIAVTAVAAVLVFAWARSRNRPPPGAGRWPARASSTTRARE